MQYSTSLPVSELEILEVKKPLANLLNWWTHENHYIIQLLTHFSIFTKTTWRWHHEFCSNHSKTWNKRWRKAPERKITLEHRRCNNPRNILELMKKKAKCKADFNRERLLPILCIKMVLRSKYLNNKFLISGPIVNSVGGGEETHTLIKNGLILPTGQWYALSAVINDAWYCMVLHGMHCIA